MDGHTPVISDWSVVGRYTKITMCFPENNDVLLFHVGQDWMMVRKLWDTMSEFLNKRSLNGHNFGIWLDGWTRLAKMSVLTEIRMALGTIQKKWERTIELLICEICQSASIAWLDSPEWPSLVQIPWTRLASKWKIQHLHAFTTVIWPFEYQ